jgi:hypothetical protein
MGGFLSRPAGWLWEDSEFFDVCNVFADLIAATEPATGTYAGLV